MVVDIEQEIRQYGKRLHVGPTEGDSPSSRIRHGLNAMKKDDAREGIVAEWDRWASRNPGDAKVMSSMLFFVYLQEERQTLLDFRSNNDKWQVVNGWLVRARRLKS